MRSKEVEVIRVLLENKEKELNINQIAKLLKKDYKNIHNMIQRLFKMRLVELQNFGKSQKVILVNQMHPLIFEAEYLRRNELLKNKSFSIMINSFEKLSSKLYVLLLFGSYAKNKQTKHSDIDLLFIVPDAAEEKMEREIHNIVRILPLKIHTNIFKETDFKAMKNSKEFTVGSEVIKNNIILHGIETYYTMIK